MSLRRFPSCLALALASACAGVGVEPVGPRRATAEVAGDLLEGFDDPSEDGAWRVGDRILVSVLLEEPGRPARTWFLRATVAEPPVPGGLVWEGGRVELPKPGGGTEIVYAERLGVDVEVFDAQGGPLAAGRTDVGELFLREGLHDAIVDLARLAGDVRAAGGLEAATDGMRDRFHADWSRFVRAQVALVQMLTRHAGVAEVRDELVRATVDLPSFWSMLFSRPKTMQFACGFEQTRREVIRGHSAVSLPIEISLDDRPVFRYRLAAAPAHPPLQLAAGLLRLEGRHPDDERRRFVVEVRAARRGPETAPVP